jgi:hypothetical protein
LIHGAYVDAWRIQRLQTETWVHTNLPRFGPPKGKDLHPACLILYMIIWCLQGAAGGGWICVACNLFASFSRGCPWWLYICSQLGFTTDFLTSTPSWRIGPCGLHVSFEQASSVADSGYAKHEDPRGHTLVSRPSQRYLIQIFPLDLTIVPPRKTPGSQSNIMMCI